MGKASPRLSRTSSLTPALLLRPPLKMVASPRRWGTQERTTSTARPTTCTCTTCDTQSGATATVGCSHTAQRDAIAGSGRKAMARAYAQRRANRGRSQGEANRWEGGAATHGQRRGVPTCIHQRHVPVPLVAGSSALLEGGQ